MSDIPRVGQLTGRARGRIGRFGRVVMQVEQWTWARQWRYPNAPFPRHGLPWRNPGERIEPTRDDFETEWVDAEPDHLTCCTTFTMVGGE